MGNLCSCCKANNYIAKETFTPTEDAFHDLPLQEGDPDAQKKADQLKIEKPLKVTIDDKLKMIQEDTGLLGPGGTPLYKMRNLTTKEMGLVLADAVARCGTVECEK